VTELDRIAEELIRAHRGDPWHGSSARAILHGVDATLASARPMPGAHSIWELVLHLTGWRREVARRIDGGAPALPECGDWPATPVPPSEAAWQQTCADFEAAHRELVGGVARLNPAALDERVGGERSREVGSGVSWYVMLHGVSQHDAYHLGQVALLRKLGRG
jgi:hypothetical protein